MNTAARLEGINKYLGIRLCVSGVTKAASPGIVFRPIASVAVKGKTEAMDLWEPLHEGALSPAFLEKYCEAYERFGQGDGALFAALARDGLDDPLAALHAGRFRGGETGTELRMTEK